jgi:hypothetical protein
MVCGVSLTAHAQGARGPAVQVQPRPLNSSVDHWSVETWEILGTYRMPLASGLGLAIACAGVIGIVGSTLMAAIPGVQATGMLP